MYEIIPPHDCFSRQLEDILKKFGKSRESVNKLIDSLKSNPLQGDRIPGFPHHLRKWRIPLKEYNIGKSGGLRLIFMILEKSERIVLIAVYYKGDIKNESNALELIKRNLHTLLNS